MSGSQVFNGYGCLLANSQLFAAGFTDLFCDNISSFGVRKYGVRFIGGDDVASLIFAKQPAVQDGRIFRNIYGHPYAGSHAHFSQCDAQTIDDFLDLVREWWELRQR